MSSDDAFAYVLDEDVVRAALPGWPADMNLILCLKADGRCEMVVCHREEEGRRALRKAAAVMARPERSFAVAPEVEGWPTRRVRFSEEQEMLKLVAEADHLEEMALDYAINWRFARDEGLDPDDVAAGRGRPRPAPEPPAPAERESVVQEVRRRLHLSLVKTDKPAGRKPRARPAAVEGGEPATPGMPVGFAPCATPARSECQFASGHIGVNGDNVRVTLAPDLVTIRTKPVRVSEIGFSADFSRFFLPRDVLKGWKAGRTAILDIPQGQFPETLRRLFSAQGFHLEATVTAEGVFLAPGAPLPVDRPKPRRRWLTPRRAAMIAVLTLGGVAGAAWATLDGAADRGAVTAMLQVLEGPAP